MNWLEATREIQKNNFVAREAWEGKRALTVTSATMKPVNQSVRIRFDMVYWNGARRTYLPSAEDLRADDWQVVPALQAALI